MPYIPKSKRELTPETWQELSFELCLKIDQWMRRHDKLNSQIIGGVWAALEGTKFAFDQEIALPYEHKKMQQNGVVFPEGQNLKLNVLNRGLPNS